MPGQHGRERLRRRRRIRRVSFRPPRRPAKLVGLAVRRAVVDGERALDVRHRLFVRRDAADTWPPRRRRRCTRRARGGDRRGYRASRSARLWMPPRMLSSGSKTLRTPYSPRRLRHELHQPARAFVGDAARIEIGFDLDDGADEDGIDAILRRRSGRCMRRSWNAGRAAWPTSSSRFLCFDAGEPKLEMTFVPSLLMMRCTCACRERTARQRVHQEASPAPDGIRTTGNIVATPRAASG